MNADHLLALFERISEAPDAIPRLRRFILDLAVRGKLVEQDPEDELAEELLKRIFAAKSKEGCDGHGLLAGSTEHDPLHDLPKGWTLTSFEGYSLSVNTGPFGTTLPQSDYIEGGIPLVNPSHMRDQVIVCDPRVSVSEQTASRLSSYRLSAGDLVIARRGEIGRVALVGTSEDGWICGTGSFFASFTEEVPRDYLLLFMQSSSARGFLGSEGIGATMTNLNQKILKRLPIPIPPLAEQHRIIAKVDELMALCDQLEAARQQREQCRERLVAASLQRLNQPSDDPEAFRSDARFALQVLPSLTTTPAQIKQLRQTILNLAVRGKLVEQDPEDEPAEELLNRVSADISSYQQTFNIRTYREKGDSSSGSAFRLPSGWQWARLSGVFRSITDGDHQAPPRADEGVPFLVISDIRSGVIDYNGSRFVPASYYESLDTTRRPAIGDLLYTLVGSFGIPVVVREATPFCVQRHIGILRPSGLIPVEFLALFMGSMLVYKQASDIATGIAQKTVPLGGLRSVRVPLPPLAEQHRIVAKVDELMALCDQLEQQLSHGEESRRGLLEAVLREALVEPERMLTSAAGASAA